MIITKLEGGLGNQMFQYAMGLAVAHRRKTKLKLELSTYQLGPTAPLRRKRRLAAPRNPRIPIRRYVLPRWNVKAESASRLELARVKLADRVAAALRPDTAYYERPIVRERQWGFDPNFLEVRDGSLLVGFWQNERYFLEIGSEIRRQFTLHDQPSGLSEELARAIQSCNSVFVHIRRGDYLAHQRWDNSKTFEVCTPGYYEAAVSLVAGQVCDPRFFIFSDEPAWVRANWRFNVPSTVVDHNPSGDAETAGLEHEDLWLMSLCRHAIVANSSFSWWGAWLNSVPDRIVVAPTVWLLNPTYESRLFVPERWTRVCL